MLYDSPLTTKYKHSIDSSYELSAKTVLYVCSTSQIIVIFRVVLIQQNQGGIYLLRLKNLTHNLNINE